MTSRPISLAQPRHRDKLRKLYRQAYRLTPAEKRARVREAYRAWQQRNEQAHEEAKQ